MKKLAAPLALALATALAAGCSDSDGEGTVAFTTYGEDYIEQEIPSADFEDGFSVKYDRFLIVLGEVSVGDEGAAPIATMAVPKVFDMHVAGEKPVVSFTNVPGRPYTRVSYAIVPATAAAEVGQGATEADRQLMIAGGYSLYAEGTISKDATTKHFAWGFSENTRYERCKGMVSGKETDGVVVTNGGTDNVELTIHGDHLFYDDLQAAQAKLRGEHIAAADADGDGTVTLEELARVRLAAIPRDQGSYGTGSAANVNDLRTFVESLSRTVGHFRGEGECVSRAR